MQRREAPRQRRDPDFRDSIEYYDDVQPLLHAYILQHNSPAVPTIAFRRFNANHKPIDNVQFFEEALSDIAANINALEPNQFFRRLVVPLPLGGHFGFAVLDLKTKELVIGEPLASGFEEPINKFKASFQKKFSDLTVIPFKIRLQGPGDNFSCGRIVPKLLTYLATTSQSLKEAINNTTEINKLKVNNEKEAKQLFDEQDRLLKEQNKLLLKPREQDLPIIYTPLLQEVFPEGLPSSQRLNYSLFYQKLHSGFIDAQFFPCVLPDPLAAYRLADASVKNDFKQLVATYIKAQQGGDVLEFFKRARKHLPPSRNNDRFLSEDNVDTVFACACNTIIPKLAANYSYHKGQLRKLDEAVERPRPSTTDTKLVGAEELWKRINKKEFRAHFLTAGHDVEFNENEVKITINTEGSSGKVVTLKKNDKNQVEVEAKSPDAETMKVMADALSEALELGDKVSIQVIAPNPSDIAPNPSDPAVIKLKDGLWLAAMEFGFEVIDYRPSDNELCRRGLDAQRAALSPNQNALRP